MASIPPFELFGSLELQVTNPLELELRLEGASPGQSPLELDDYVDVMIHNRSGSPIELAAPDDPGEIYVQIGDRLERIVIWASVLLKPGEGRNLLGFPSDRSTADLRVEQPASTGIRVAFRRPSWSDGLAVPDHRASRWTPAE